MKNPLVSISIPVYNQELYLHQCVNSVLAQTYQNWECVLIDDGSTDNSAAICDEYAAKDTRIRIIHKSNAGLAAARQTGLECSVGKYIVNIDSDDWIEPNHIENMVYAAEKEQADIVICPYYQNVGEKQTYIECRPSAFDLQTLQCEALDGKYHAGVVLKLFARKLFTENPIKPAPYSYYEDMFTYISCLQFAKKVIYIPSATYHYRYNNDSLTNIPKIATRISMYEQCMLNLVAIVEQFGYNDNKNFMSAIYARANHEKIRLLVFIKEYYKVLSYIKKYFPLSPVIINAVDLHSWGTKHALNGNMIPYLLFKVVNYSRRKIKVLFK